MSVCAVSVQSLSTCEKPTSITSVYCWLLSGIVSTLQSLTEGSEEGEIHSVPLSLQLLFYLELSMLFAIYPYSHVNTVRIDKLGFRKLKVLINQDSEQVPFVLQG